MKLIPEGAEAVLASNPLIIDEAKAAEMLAKVKEFHTKVMEAGELMLMLNNFYIYGQTEKEELVEGHVSEHYTKKQLMEPINALYLELNPIPEPEVVEEEEPVIPE